MNLRQASRLRSAPVGIVLLATVLVACAPAGNGSASPSVSSPVEESPSAIGSSSPTPAVTAEPTDDLGAFACEMPIEGEGTVDRAQITDVRVGSHTGYDRIVIEFDAGVPPFTLDEATPPLTADPSGQQMDVDGDAFWSLVLQGGTRLNLDGSMSYDGQTDFTPDFPALAELVQAGDFEAVSSWYIGLHEATCARVLTLTEPSRLVIDIQQ